MFFKFSLSLSLTLLLLFSTSNAQIPWNNPPVSLLTGSDTDTEIGLAINRCSGKVLSVFQHAGQPHTLVIPDLITPRSGWSEFAVTSINGAPTSINNEWSNPIYDSYSHTPDVAVDQHTDTWIMVFSTPDHMVLSKFNEPLARWDFITAFTQTSGLDATIKSDGRGNWMAGWHSSPDEKLYTIVSNDNGVTWSTPTAFPIITSRFPTFLPLPIKNSDTYLAPTNPVDTPWLMFFVHQDGTHLESGRFMAEGVTLTTDGGVTWSQPNGTAIPGFIEIESYADNFVYTRTAVDANLRSDGSNRIVMSTISGRLIRSLDWGQSWVLNTFTTPYFATVSAAGFGYNSTEITGDEVWGSLGGHYDLTYYETRDIETQAWRQTTVLPYLVAGYPIRAVVDSYGRWFAIYRRTDEILTVLSSGSTGYIDRGACDNVPSPIPTSPTSTPTPPSTTPTSTPSQEEEISNYCADASAAGSICDIKLSVFISFPTTLNTSLAIDDSGTLVVGSTLRVERNLTGTSGAVIRIDISSGDETPINVSGCLSAEGSLEVSSEVLNSILVGSSKTLIEYSCLGPGRLTLPNYKDDERCPALKYTSTSLQLLMGSCADTVNNSEEAGIVTWHIVVIVVAVVLTVVVIGVVMLFFRNRVFIFRNRARYSVEDNQSSQRSQELELEAQ